MTPCVSLIEFLNVFKSWGLVQGQKAGYKIDHVVYEWPPVEFCVSSVLSKQLQIELK